MVSLLHCSLFFLPAGNPGNFIVFSHCPSSPLFFLLSPFVERLLSMSLPSYQAFMAVPLIIAENVNNKIELLNKYFHWAFSSSSDKKSDCYSAERVRKKKKRKKSTQAYTTHYWTLQLLSFSGYKPLLFSPH